MNLFITSGLIVIISGHADEFRLGELVTLTLEFNQLDDNFDYRLNKCWTLDSNNDGKIFSLSSYDEIFNFRGLSVGK